jgi:AraC family transcriptional regulator
MRMRYVPMMKTIPNILPVHEAFGICCYTERFKQNGLFYYLAGAPVSNLEEIPLELDGKTLPASEYAVFTHKGKIVGKTGSIRDAYAYAYGTWLPSSQYMNPYPYDSEYYSERFTGNEDPDTERDIYIPIKRRS